MYSFVIKFYEEGNVCSAEYRKNSVDNLLIINNEFVENILNDIKQQIKPESLKFWDMYLVSDNLNIEVRDYTLFEKISIFKASDGAAKINVIKSDTNLHLVNLEIDIIQIIDCNILIADSKVNKLDFEIENFMKVLNNQQIIRKNQDYKIDVRHSTLEEVSIYHSLSLFNMQGATIKNIEFHSSANQKINIGFMNIWQGCKIGLMRLGCELKKIKFEDSNISRLYFTQRTLIQDFSIVKSFFDNVFGSEMCHFEKHGIHELELIKQSAAYDNEKLYFETSYKLAMLRGKEGNPIANWFLKNSIGYGYKPQKAVSFILFVIMSFAGLYSLVDLYEYLMGGNELSFTIDNIKYSLSQFLDRIYFSGITFTTTGYGDITPGNFVLKFLSVFESCIGVIMFSLFIYALTIRYLSKK